MWCAIRRPPCCERGLRSQNSCRRTTMEQPNLVLSPQQSAVEASPPPPPSSSAEQLQEASPPVYVSVRPLRRSPWLEEPLSESELSVGDVLYYHGESFGSFDGNMRVHGMRGVVQDTKRFSILFDGNESATTFSVEELSRAPPLSSEDAQLRWLATSEEDADAQYHLGTLLARGVPRALAESRRWYGAAAAQGHAESQHALGRLHMAGFGGPQDYAEARRLMELAAARGHTRAMSALRFALNTEPHFRTRVALIATIPCGGRVVFFDAIDPAHNFDSHLLEAFCEAEGIPERSMARFFYRGIEISERPFINNHLPPIPDLAVIHVTLQHLPLLYAATRGDVATLRSLCDAGGDVNQCVDGCTPLAEAARRGHIACIEVLLKNGADPTLSASWHRNSSLPPLIGGVVTLQLNVVKLLSEFGATRTNRGENAVEVLEKELRDYERILHLLPNFVSTFSKLHDWLTRSQHWAERLGPLEHAAAYGRVASLRILTAANLEACREHASLRPTVAWEHASALRLASEEGHAACVRVLLDAGADCNRFRPLAAAARHGHDRCVEALCAVGAAVDLADESGSTPLVLAARHGHSGCIRVLCVEGAAASYGRSLLVLATRHGHADSIRALRASGADDGFSGATLLFPAIAYGYDSCVRALLSTNASPDFSLIGAQALVEEVRQALMQRDRIEMLFLTLFLQRQRAERSTLAAADGFTPLYFAALTGQTECFRALMEAGAACRSCPPSAVDDADGPDCHHHHHCHHVCGATFTFTTTTTYTTLESYSYSDEDEPLSKRMAVSDATTLAPALPAPPEPHSLSAIPNDLLHRIATSLDDPLAPDPSGPAAATALASTCRGIRAAIPAAAQALRRYTEAGWFGEQMDVIPPGEDATENPEHAPIRERKRTLTRAELAQIREFGLGYLVGVGSLRHGIKFDVKIARVLTHLLSSDCFSRLEKMYVTFIEPLGFNEPQIMRGVIACDRSLHGATRNLPQTVVDRRREEERWHRKEADAASERLLAALARSALPQLRELRWELNRQQAVLFMDALQQNLAALPALEVLDLSGGFIDDEGMIALVDALAAGALPQLKDLRLNYCNVGDAGIAALARSGVDGTWSTLEGLSLPQDDCQSITSAGWATLAAALNAGALPAIKELYPGDCNLEAPPFREEIHAGLQSAMIARGIGH